MSREPNPRALFVASCMALIVTAMSFAVRGDIMGALGTQFALNHEEIGWVAGSAFWGFTLAMIFGGPLCDVLGMGLLLRGAFVLHLLGVIVTIFATGFWSLFAGTLAIGIGNGLVEAACNPLVAALYPHDKTHRLNQFHVWFPGGIVIGGLACYALTHLHANWQVKMAAMLVPTLVYGGLFLGLHFPRTERVVSGISTQDMFKACFTPLFILMVACMFLTASTELGPGQWIPDIMQGINAEIPGILLLVWINGLMALGRQFAGPVVHRLSPTGVLLVSALFAAAGLFLLSFASNTATAFAAATVFAVGVCYFWPTMLGVVSELVPKSGALGLAVMGGAGMLSVSFILPFIGSLYDAHKDQPGVALRSVTVLPVILIAVFAALWGFYRARGGYKAVKI